MRNIQIGDEVYISDLRQFGTVQEITPSGRISKVKITTGDGDQIINTLTMIVTIARLIETGLLPIIKAIYLEIKSWFK